MTMNCNSNNAGCGQPIRFTDALAKINNEDKTTNSNKYQRSIAIERYANFLRHAGIEDSVRAMTMVTWNAWRLYLMRSDYSICTANTYCSCIKRLLVLWNKACNGSIDISQFTGITEKMK